MKKIPNFVNRILTLSIVFYILFLVVGSPALFADEKSESKAVFYVQ